MRTCVSTLPLNIRANGACMDRTAGFRLTNRDRHASAARQAGPLAGAVCDHRQKRRGRPPNAPTLRPNGRSVDTLPGDNRLHCTSCITSAAESARLWIVTWSRRPCSDSVAEVVSLRVPMINEAVFDWMADNVIVGAVASATPFT